MTSNEQTNNSTEITPKRDTYDGFRDSTQTFSGVGLLEASFGDVILRGRNGQRDCLYPLDKALDRYNQTKRMVVHMAHHGIQGWDTLMDIADELRARILEACEQRRGINREIPEAVMDFEKQCQARKENIRTNLNPL